MLDAQLTLDLAARLLLSAVFGAAVGLERELHGHPAGMRTHLLVSLGSGLFTVLSIYGFPGTSGAPVDTSRIAAQIVTGVGFLGAGAIIKDGFSIRGLTTAASLWATAAIGLAAGAGQHVLALFATVIVVFSLWPLNRVAERIHGAERQVTTIRLSLSALDLLAQVSAALTSHRLEITDVRTERLSSGRQEVEFDVRVRGSSDLSAGLDALSHIDGVRLDRAGPT